MLLCIYFISLCSSQPDTDSLWQLRALARPQLPPSLQELCYATGMDFKIRHESRAYLIRQYVQHKQNRRTHHPAKCRDMCVRGKTDPPLLSMGDKLQQLRRLAAAATGCPLHSSCRTHELEEGQVEIEALIFLPDGCSGCSPHISRSF